PALAYLPSGTVLPATTVAVSHEWLNSYNAATGAFGQIQPAAADLSDTATSGNVLRGNGTSFVSAQLGYSDLSGAPTLATTTTRTAHEFMGAYSAVSGAFTFYQPAVADLSDVPSANTVLAGPTTGAAAAPTFRALVPADMPVDSTARDFWQPCLGDWGIGLSTNDYTGVNNLCYFCACQLTKAITISKVTINVTTKQNTSSMNIGIYKAD